MATNRKTSEQLLNELNHLKYINQAPSDMGLEAYATLYKNLYQYESGEVETPMGMYSRVSKTAAKHLPLNAGIENDFFYLISNNYLGLATPVSANLGTPANSFPISCFVLSVEDSVESIFNCLYRAAMLTKGGGGVGVGLQNIRPSGEDIKGGGKSNGAKPWATIYDTASRIVSQAGVRRGQFSFYIDIESNDLWDFLLAKDHSKGDPKTHIHSNIAVNIKNNFIEKLVSRDLDAVARWNSVLRTRLISGSPYLHFVDNANRDLVPWLKELGKKITGSNICTEISSCADKASDMVCCLSSLNLYKYDEWQYWKSPTTGLNAIETSIYFLDGVMSSFISDVQTQNSPGLEEALNYAVKGRPLGLGVFGYHAYLMKNAIAFKSYAARNFNATVFSSIAVSADRASKKLASEYGCCEWAASVGRRNIQTTAIAPTVGNSVTSGGITPGIEPIAGHYYEAKGAAGSWVRINPILVDFLKRKNIYREDVMESILDNSGSVQHLQQLSEHELKVFLTFNEIDQREIIFQAAQRQKYLEQTQSVNLSFNSNADPEYINDVHLMAYYSGMHTLYYLRSNSVQRVAIGKSRLQSSRKSNNEAYVVFTKENCIWCTKALELLQSLQLNFRLIEEKDLSDPENKKLLGLFQTISSYPKIARVKDESSELVGGYSDLVLALHGKSFNNESESVGCEMCDG